MKPPIDLHDLRKSDIEDAMIEEAGKHETIFSPCRKWRYTLWRKCPVIFSFEEKPWKGNYVMFIGLNPSTADEKNDDPTIRRCRDFASRWGFLRMCMTNIFAWRDTDPEKMKAAQDPVGPDNNKWLLEIARGAGLIIAAWGNHGTHLGRSEMVCDALLKIGCKVHCLGKNGNGEPKHPLYLSSKLKPMDYKTPQLSIANFEVEQFEVEMGKGEIK